MLFLLFICASFSCCFADEGQREYLLFAKADNDNDTRLSHQDLDKIFLLFDSNNDSRITPNEFTDDWTNKFSIGAPSEAQTLFTKADTNDDGYIDSKDIPAIFTFFDMNGDGSVDINEFLTKWGDLKLHPLNSVDISVDITG